MVALTILKRMRNIIKEREISKVSDMGYKWNYDILYFMISNNTKYYVVMAYFSTYFNFKKISTYLAV